MSVPDIGVIPFKDASHFKAGSIHEHCDFWSSHVLKEAPADTRDFLSDVLLHGFDVPSYFTSVPPRLTGRVRNRIPSEFTSFVTAQLQSALASGAARVSLSRPHTVLPMSIEPAKPRLIIDGRPINRYTREIPFTMESLGDVPKFCGPDVYMASLDHKSGYHHVFLSERSRTFFGVEWELPDANGVLRPVYLEWCVLTFGYSLAPFVYQSLSSAVSSYLRRGGVPTTSWIDDFLSSGLPPGAVTSWDACSGLVPCGALPPPSEAALLQAGRRAAFLLAAVMRLCGYFVSLAKSVLSVTRSLRYLGFVLDSHLQCFFIPSDKKTKFLALVGSVLSSDMVSFQTLEKLHGKAVSMARAVPAARLLARGMQRLITKSLRRFPAARHSGLSVRLDPQSRADLNDWLSIQDSLTGGPWLEPQHQGYRIKLRVESDASSRRWGAALFLPNSLPAPSGGSSPFEAGAEFAADELPLSINEKEMVAVIRLVESFVHAEGEAQLRGKRLDFWVDNRSAVAYFTKGGGRSEALTRLARRWFELQVQYAFVATFQWWGTKENVRADGITRLNPADDACLSPHVFSQLSSFFRCSFNVAIVVDLMASPASAQRDAQGLPLPFVSRFHVGSEKAVDVLGQDIPALVTQLSLPFTPTPGFSSSSLPVGYCFPPASMRASVIHHAARCHARVVFILPRMAALWWPLVLSARVGEWVLPLPPSGDPLFTMAASGGVTRAVPLVPGQQWLAILCAF